MTVTIDPPQEPAGPVTSSRAETPGSHQDATPADSSHRKNSSALSRRSFLCFGAAAGMLAAPSVARANLADLMCRPTLPPPPMVQVARAELLHRQEHAQEEIHLASNRSRSGRWVSIRMNKRPETYHRQYFRNGAYIREALDEWNFFCRDGDGNIGAMDPRTLDLLWEISQRLRIDTPMVLTSGFRSRAYNARLRGAARDSLHMHGRALDIWHPGVPVSQVHRAALAAQAGGVGRYRNFVHVDTGPRRFWDG